MKAPIWVLLCSCAVGFSIAFLTGMWVRHDLAVPVLPESTEVRHETAHVDLAISSPDRSPVAVDEPTPAPTSIYEPLPVPNDAPATIDAGAAAELARLRAALDECRNGTFSALGNARALPEWGELDEAQRREVVSFLESFPVMLTPGEARLIATHTYEGGDRVANLILILGRERVLASVPTDARIRLQRDDPDRFADYFGTGG